MIIHHSVLFLCVPKSVPRWSSRTNFYWDSIQSPDVWVSLEGSPAPWNQTCFHLIQPQRPFSDPALSLMLLPWGLSLSNASYHWCFQATCYSWPAPLPRTRESFPVSSFGRDLNKMMQSSCLLKPQKTEQKNEHWPKMKSPGILSTSIPPHSVVVETQHCDSLESHAYSSTLVYPLFQVLFSKILPKSYKGY